MSVQATAEQTGSDSQGPAHAPISEQVLTEITQQLAASASEYDRDAVFPRQNFELLQRLGLIGLTVAPELGGRGARYVEALRVLRAVAKGEPSTALILFMTYAYHFGRTQNWPHGIYERFARDTVQDGALVGGLRVEPELGTPVRGGMPKTEARRSAAGFLLSGRKIYSTGSTGLRWFAVWAKTDEPEPRVGTFLVRSDWPGIRIEPTWNHLGMRASVSHDVVFTDTPVPLDHAVDVRLPQDWIKGGADASAWIWGTLAIATIYDAVASAARDWLQTYLKQRVPSNLGAPLSSLPRVQEHFGEIEALLYVNRVLLDNAARRADAGEAISGNETNLIKYHVTGNAIRAVQIGLELTGNPGLTRNNPLERHYRDVLCSRVHSPQNDTILVGVGKAGFEI